MLNIFESSATRWRKALTEPLSAEDSIEYYETRFLDLTISLSPGDKAQIDRWMSICEDFSSDTEDPLEALTAREKRLVKHWMTVSCLSRNINPGAATPFEYVENLVVNMTERYYRWCYSLSDDDFKVSPEERRQS